MTPSTRQDKQQKVATPTLQQNRLSDDVVIRPSPNNFMFSLMLHLLATQTSRKKGTYAHLVKRSPMLHQPAFPNSLLQTSLRARSDCPRIPSGTKHLVIPVAYPISTARPRPEFAGAEIHKETPSKRNASARPACDEYLQRTVSSNTSSGHMPNAMVMTNFKHYMPTHIGSAMA